MSRLAPVLQGFFTDKLITQKHASPHTVSAYRDTWRLLLTFAWQSTGIPPWKMNLGQLDHDLVTGFLRYLETGRNNSLRTRNARLAAIHSMFRYAALREPEHAAAIQRVLAIREARPPAPTSAGSPMTKPARCWPPATAPPGSAAATTQCPATALRTGLRVSELTRLTCDDVHLGAGAHVHCLGKGRKERCTPLDKPTAAALREWLTERSGQPADPLFPARRGGVMSRDAFQARLNQYKPAAAETCPSLAAKKLAPHVLRHTAAMTLRRSGVDTGVIALWLGHFSGDLKPSLDVSSGACGRCFVRPSAYRASHG